MVKSSFGSGSYETVSMIQIILVFCKLYCKLVLHTISGPTLYFDGDMYSEVEGDINGNTNVMLDVCQTPINFTSIASKIFDSSLVSAESETDVQ